MDVSYCASFSPCSTYVDDRNGCPFGAPWHVQVGQASEHLQGINGGIVVVCVPDSNDDHHLSWLNVVKWVPCSSCISCFLIFMS